MIKTEEQVLTKEKEYLDKDIMKEKKKIRKKPLFMYSIWHICRRRADCFSEVNYLDGVVKIYLPETFTDMSEKIRNVKYSGKNSPSVIKMKEGRGNRFFISKKHKRRQETRIDECRESGNRDL